MNDKLKQALQELILIQDARILNWATIKGPTDDHLETIHLAHIAILKKKIETILKSN
jgi:succinate dehydrogenase flavin-adding protein (antitoxin of CptAB toxin-antitoxin module)